MEIDEPVPLVRRFSPIFQSDVDSDERDVLELLGHTNIKAWEEIGVFWQDDCEETPMKKSRYTERQIVNILKQADAGMQVKEICRKYGDDKDNHNCEVRCPPLYGVAIFWAISCS